MCADEDDYEDRPRRRSRDDDDMDEDEDFDDEPRGRSRRGGGSASGRVTGVGVISIVLGSLVTLASFCFLLGGLFFAGAANDIRNMPNMKMPNNANVNVNAGAGFFAVFEARIIIVGILILVFGIGQIMSGVGVLRRRQWGRILCMVIAGFYAVAAIFTLIGIFQYLSLPAGFPGKTWSILMGLLQFVVEVGYTVMVYTVLLSRPAASEFR